MRRIVFAATAAAFLFACTTTTDNAAIRLDNVSAFANHLVVNEKEGRLPHLRIRDLKSADRHRLTSPEPTYSVFSGVNKEIAVPSEPPVVRHAAVA